MPLQLSAGDPAHDTLIQGRVVIAVGDQPVTIDLTVPDGKVSIERLLPILQGLTNFIVDHGVATAEAEGRKISCCKGCGACCNQLVPVSQSEARALGRLVAAMPEPRQTHVRQRFQQALGALEAEGLLAQIDLCREDASRPVRELGLRYFLAGVPCPFLEDGACTIHPDRPLACRQYLVTSPAANCAIPSPTNLAPVVMPARPSTALLLADTADSGVRWLPLVYSVIYHDNVEDPAPTRTAPEILQDIFARLKAPTPDAAPETG